MAAGRPHFPEIPEPLAGLLRAESLELFGVAETDAGGPRDAGNHDRSPRATAAAGDLTASERAAAEYDEWIAGGMHGGMTYLARHAPLKYDPAAVLPGCRSVIVVGLNYFQERRSRSKAAAPEGRVARYAWGRDYHNVLGKRLRRVVKTLRERFPGESFRGFVDSSPLSERFFAAQAGVGFTGRNTLTLTGAFGSWFFLGEVLSTLAIPASTAPPGIHGACPRSCFRCGDSCPTGALFAPHRIDARRCISYLTIEHRGSIAEELRPLMGSWIFGCDLCQESCPLNVRAIPTDVGDFTAHRAGEAIRLAELLTIADDEAYRRRFAGTPLMRPGREAMIRNALIAAANTGAAELLPHVQALARDESELIREHARWALDYLAKV